MTPKSKAALPMDQLCGLSELRFTNELSEGRLA